MALLDDRCFRLKLKYFHKTFSLNCNSTTLNAVANANDIPLYRQADVNF